MKMVSNLKLKTASVVIACILLFSTLPLNLGLVSAQGNTFEFEQVGSGECTVDEDGILNLNLHSWSQANANFKIDLLKGFQFKFTTFGKTHFYFKGEDKTVTYVNELILWEDSSGILHCQRALDGHGNKEFGSPKDQAHYFKFVPVTSGETITGYELLLDNKSFNGGGIIWTVEDFKKYNNYNESTGTFEGTYLSVLSEDTPPELSINLENNYFDRSSNPAYNSAVCTLEDFGIYNLKFSGWSMAVSNFKTDLLKGFQFKFTTFGKSHIYFSNGIDSNEAKELILWQDTNGDLLCDITGGGYQTNLGAATDQAHYLEFVPVTSEEVITGYELRIDNKPLGGGVIWSVEDFKKYNNYNESTGTFDGTYLRFSDEGVAPELRINTDNNYFDRSPNTAYNSVACIVQDFGMYNLKFSGWSMAISNFQVDLLKGFQFNYTTFGKTHFYFVNEMNSDEAKELILRQDTNGDLLCDVAEGGYETRLGVAVNKTHYLNFVPVTAEETGEITGYELRIDDKALGGGVVWSVEQFKRYNNYNESTGTFSGTYLRFFDEGVAPEMKIKIVKAGDDTSIPDDDTPDPSEPINPADQIFTGSVTTTAADDGTYNVSLLGYACAKSTFQVDLRSGFTFNISDLPANGTWLVFGVGSRLSEMPNDPTAGTTDLYPIWVRNNNGTLKISTDKDLILNYLSVSDTHTMSFRRMGNEGAYYYRLCVDGHSIDDINISEEKFNKMNNYDASTDTYAGAYIKFGSGGNFTIKKFSIVPSLDSDYICENSSVTAHDGKYNISLEQNGKAISAWNADLTLGLAFTPESLDNVLTLRLAKNNLVLTNGENNAAEDIRPVIKLKNNGGKVAASIANDNTTEAYNVLEGVSVSGEHILKVKKKMLNDAVVYRFYIDNVEINSSYYLSEEQFNILCSYYIAADIFKGTAFAFSSEASVKINNISEVAYFIGGGATYKQIEDGHFNVNLVPWYPTYAKWTADLSSGLAFNIETAGNGWIIFNFCNDFDTLYSGSSTVSTYQPTLLMKNEADGLYVAILNGEIHKSPTKLKGVKLEGSHILSVKLVTDENTGLKYYKFFFDGMAIVNEYTMSASVFKRINNYDKATDSFGGVYASYTAQDGARLKNVHEMENIDVVNLGDWDATSNASVTKINDNTFNLNMGQLSSVASIRAVNFEKGLKLTIENPESDLQFGIGMSMMPNKIVLDAIPAITDKNSLYYMFSRNSDNTYNVMSTKGLTAKWSGDLSGTHTYSMVKIQNPNGETRYTLAIDGTAVFNDGLVENDYILLSNASRGSYPVVFSKNNLIIKNLTGEFLAKGESGNGNLWDDDWFDETDTEDNVIDSDTTDDFYDDATYDDDNQNDKDEEPITKRVLVGREKIEQEPIITYRTNWWFIIAIAVGVILVVAGVFIFFPFKKK